MILDDITKFILMTTDFLFNVQIKCRLNILNSKNLILFKQTDVKKHNRCKI